MKLRKIISLAVTSAIVMANAVVISMPSASAAVVTNAKTSTEYTENFDTLGAQNANTTQKTTLLGDGWYIANRTQLITDTSDNLYNYEVAQLMAGSGDNKTNCLRIIGSNTTSYGNAFYFYGYGKAFPGIEPNEPATGSWEISFDFKPVMVSSQAQFAFSLVQADGGVTGDGAANNILACTSTDFYIGYHNFNSTKNNSVTQGILPATQIGGATWYTVKVYVNCDAKYYSVELHAWDGTLIARRSPISFVGDTISFLKFSAYNKERASAVFVDNVSIKRAEKETTIYNETFNSFKNGSYRASTGMTTGAAADDTAGTSYFEGYTPWRFNSSVGNAYALSSGSVKLGALSESTSEGSGLVYMPVGETMVDAATQSKRGMLRLSFKIKPEKIASDVTVNVIPASNYDITNPNYAFFKILNDSGTAKLDKGSDGTVAINKTLWYAVTMDFDVVNRAVKTTVQQQGSSAKLTFVKVGNTTPNAVKAIMFKVDGGSSVLVDDIKIEYNRPNPSVKAADLVLKDKGSNIVADNNNATSAIGTIDIPLNTILNSSAATGITLKDSSGNDVSFTGEVATSPTYKFGDIYRLTILEEALKQNETYTITVPASVASTYGGTLGSPTMINFKTEVGVEEIDTETVLDEVVDKDGATVELTETGVLDIGEGLNFRNGYVDASKGYVKTGNRQITGSKLKFTSEGKVQLENEYSAKISRDNGDGTTTQGFMFGLLNPSGIRTVILDVTGGEHDGKTVNKDFDFTDWETYGLVNFGFEIKNIPALVDFSVKSF